MTPSVFVDDAFTVTDPRPPIQGQDCGCFCACCEAVPVIASLHERRVLLPGEQGPPSGGTQ